MNKDDIIKESKSLLNKLSEQEYYSNAIGDSKRILNKRLGFISRFFLNIRRLFFILFGIKNNDEQIFSHETYKVIGVIV